MRALFAVELRRLRRNRRALVFTAVLPAFFFLAFSSSLPKTLGGIDLAPYVMVSMATYGAMNALFTGAGVIAAERSVGWSRQLRVAGLPGGHYVATKVAVSYVSALPGLVLVLAIAAWARHVQLSPVTWVEVAASVLAALLPVAALGVAVGYLARPQALQAVFGIGSALLALLGGLWIPVTTFPGPLRQLVEALPTYWSAAAGRAVLLGGWVGWHGVAVLAGWTAVLGAAAAYLYRRDALRPSAAGTT